MIPNLKKSEAPSSLTLRFLEQLVARGFSGEISSSTAQRLLAGTDNSIYQLMPQSVVFPQNQKDIKILATLLGWDEFRAVKVTPRGGGTGTNGQSLTEGITVDMSRHLNHILEINKEEKWVRIEPGVVLDQLNAELKPLGLFFAPTLSTSSRATLGGMINTDACGKGSRIYGKTSDHILELTCRLSGGQGLHTKQFDQSGWEQESQGNSGSFYQLMDQILADYAQEITELPQLDRFVTGYNLNRLKQTETGKYSLNYLIAGSEGTLAFVTEAKLNLLALPKHKSLLALRYPSFDQALRGAEELVQLNPAAIETIDDNILLLAEDDPIYDLVGPMIRPGEGEQVKAINLVEFLGDDPAELAQQMLEITDRLNVQILSGVGPSGCYEATDPQEIESLWELRKKGVGLLGNTKGNRRPVPFVEDTVVPPKHLANYIKEFRALLESHGLKYGMFGHVDVGCLHVRPALNLKDPKDEALVKIISDEVANLVHKYGGVIWGEHGKGFRSEYTKRYFGPTLYEQLGRIKQAFDPFNQLNPGKITVPTGSTESLVSVDGPSRGQRDRQIDKNLQVQFETAITCNGNGACFNVSPKVLICPSSKSSRDRVQSPKGRAGLMREWLTRLSKEQWQPNQIESRFVVPILKLGYSLGRVLGRYDFSHEVYEGMDGCLSCKACVTGCPIKVDVPEMKAEFLQHYHRRYIRPLADHLAGQLETIMPWVAQFPKLSRGVLSQPWVRSLLSNWVGIVDPPLPSKRPVSQMLRSGKLKLLSLEEPPTNLSPDKDVILIQDSFTSLFESKLILTLNELCQQLDVNLWVLPLFPNGKALHVKGKLQQFKAQVQANHWILERAAQLKIPMVGVDPAVTLTYRDEYPKTLGIDSLDYKVLLPQEWLVRQMNAGYIVQKQSTGTQVKLLGHCTQKALVAPAQGLWKQIFQHLGVNLEAVEVGCCGMSGMFGHETRHFNQSREIFDLSWRGHIESAEGSGIQLVADGFSCRSQTKRLTGTRLQHPLEVLLSQVSQRESL